MKKIYALIFIVFLCSNIVLASTWKSLTTNEKTIYIDTTSIQPYVDESGFEYMYYIVKNTNSSGAFISGLISNCDDNQVGIFATYKVDAQENILSSKENKPIEMTFVKAGSTGEAAHKYVCDVYDRETYSVKTYSKQAETALENNDYSTALFYAKKAETAAITLKNKGYSVYNLSNSKDIQARAYSGMGDTQKAYNYMKEAVSLSKQMNDPQYTAQLEAKLSIFESVYEINENEKERQKKEEQYKNEERQRAFQAEEAEKQRKHELRMKQLETGKQIFNTGADLVRRFAY